MSVESLISNFFFISFIKLLKSNTKSFFEFDYYGQLASVVIYCFRFKNDIKKILFIILYFN